MIGIAVFIMCIVFAASLHESFGVLSMEAQDTYFVSVTMGVAIFSLAFISVSWDNPSQWLFWTFCAAYIAPVLGYLTGWCSGLINAATERLSGRLNE